MGVPVESLAPAQLFKALSKQQLDEIARLVQREEHEADSVVLREGSPHEAVYVIKAGKVGVSTIHPKYKVPMLVEELEAGDSFGLVALTTSGSVEATFSTLTKATLYRLDRQDFNAASKRSPGLVAGVARALAARMAREREHKEVPFLNLGGRQLDRRLWALAPENLLIANRMVPLELVGKTLTVGMVDPEDVGALRDLAAVMAGFTIKLVAISGQDIDRFVAAGFGKKRHRVAMIPASERPAIVFMDDDASLTDKSPAVAGHIVSLASEIVSTALAIGASDIHFEVEAKGGVVRYRVDGQLRQRPDIIAVENTRPLLSRFKLLAKMDITETRRPRDGRISLTAGKRVVDLRVSTVPAKFGEKVVIRLLDSASNISSLRNIISVDPVREVFTEMLARPHGLILVTGPTGSGKTTTLYTALAERRRPEINMVTVEDPIEYHLDGVTQVQTNSEIGTNFEVLLRGILRQDPDVIMIGETRDRETARIAIEASMTGHLVLTSVHTNSAVDAIMRLVDLGAERYSIATGLMSVVHQRLVRRLCPHCKEPFEYPQPITERLRKAGVLQEGSSTTTLYRGIGCDACHGSGFRGRIAVYELLNVNEPVKHAIATGVEPAVLREVALSSNALFDISRYARVMLARGDTAPPEVLHLAEQGVSSEAFAREDQAPAPQVNRPALSMPWLKPEAVNITAPPEGPRISALPNSPLPAQAPLPRGVSAAPEPLPRMSASPAESVLQSGPLPPMSLPVSAPRSLKAQSPQPAARPATTEPSRGGKEESPPPVLDLDLFGD